MNFCLRDHPVTGLSLGRASSARALLPMLLMIALVLVACAKEKPKPQRIVPVVVGTTVQKDVPVELHVIGSVEAYSVVSVKSQVAGKISRVHFKEGHDVRKGDLIFTIDPRPFEAVLKQSEANLAKDIALAANAEEDAKRYRFLIEKGYVAAQQYDQVKANAEALTATVKADRAQVDNNRLLLEYCFIRSPLDGRTGTLIVHEGNVVKENETVLTTINQINPINVTFSVPEKYLADIKKYMARGKLAVQAFISKDDARPEVGVLTFVDNTVDTATGTIKLKGTFTNKEKRLWPGQFVDVMLVLTTQPNAIVVPSQALQTGQEGQYVFVVKSDMTAEVRPVVVGFTMKGESVIEKGLKANETVVTDGQLRLTPGAKVSIKNQEGTR